MVGGEGARSGSRTGAIFWSRTQNSRTPEFETGGSNILGRRILQGTKVECIQRLVSLSCNF